MTTVALTIISDIVLLQLCEDSIRELFATRPKEPVLVQPQELPTMLGDKFGILYKVHTSARSIVVRSKKAIIYLLFVSSVEKLLITESAFRGFESKFMSQVKTTITTKE